MSAHEDSPGGLFGRARRIFSHKVAAPEECDHPHARQIQTDGKTDTILVCEQCGHPLDAHDPVMRRKQHLNDARVCVDCASTRWTVGTRRSI
jgi:hypothetical protein